MIYKFQSLLLLVIAGVVFTASAGESAVDWRLDAAMDIGQTPIDER